MRDPRKYLEDGRMSWLRTTEKPVLEIGDTMHPASKDNSEE